VAKPLVAQNSLLACLRVKFVYFQQMKFVGVSFMPDLFIYHGSDKFDKIAFFCGVC